MGLRHWDWKTSRFVKGGTANCGLLTHISSYTPFSLPLWLDHASSSIVMYNAFLNSTDIVEKSSTQPLRWTLLRKGCSSRGPLHLHIDPPTRPVAIDHMTCWPTYPYFQKWVLNFVNTTPLLFQIFKKKTNWRLSRNDPRKTPLG